MPKRRWFSVRMLAMLAVALEPAALAKAAPPEGSEAGAYRGYENWFKSLTSPLTGKDCCDLADCRFVAYRHTPAGYTVLINGQWLPVPDRLVIRHRENPTGRGVACYRQDSVLVPSSIFCFIPAPEG